MLHTALIAVYSQLGCCHLRTAMRCQNNLIAHQLQAQYLLSLPACSAHYTPYRLWVMHSERTCDFTSLATSLVTQSSYTHVSPCSLALPKQCSRSVRTITHTHYTMHPTFPRRCLNNPLANASQCVVDASCMTYIPASRCHRNPQRCHDNP